MKKTYRLTLGIVAGLAFALILIVLYQNSYKMTEEKIQIATPKGVLTGTLALPKNYSGKIGLVVFVHGDGPINDTYDDGYKPLWERFASKGYASLSLNKPGINGAPGNWLEQSMEDRAQEIRYAVAWAKTLPMIDKHKIGLWGASQAGWVIPKIVKEEHDIAFSILVSPAVNWITQGQFNTRKELEQEGASPQQIKKRLDYDQKTLQLLKKHASYEEYLSMADPENIIPKERWSFIGKNFRSDSTKELSYFKSPVLLVLAGKDMNVDVKDTERVYRQKISPELLSVIHLPKVDHSMMNEQIAHSKSLTFLTAIFAPRQLVDDEYLKILADYVSQH
ncbi:alpha/beta hydrolase [Paenibacillus sp. EKM202P]|uniref:alpha/beta hydrolase family protein n=1 Tax=unclassified Paenibacillus TaxID=185978 RepID=UPI0013EC8BFB|nr:MULTISPECIES: alpha/beta hydrolase [unclassified Paenibacillus]KAF6558624.1 alpha/beta hydrolase [Paenibacillus sp. EKM202P]KAF6563579.1 alpha/beta hydrolase [Paenibacillus sp. EKM207P]